MRRPVAGLAVAVIIVIAGLGGHAYAQVIDDAADPVAKLAFVGRAKPVLRLVDGNTLATTTVIVSNSGTADADGVTFHLLQDGAGPLDACGVQELETGASLTDEPCAGSTPHKITLAVGESKRFLASFKVDEEGPLPDPLIEVRSTTKEVLPAFAELTVLRSLSDGRLWWPIWVSLSAAALFLAWGSFLTRGAVNRDGTGRRAKRWATAKIFTDASWSFKDSWATNIAALGGLLGTVLSATGFFTDVLPGVSSGRFTGFSLVFGGLALLAPVVYTALGRRDAASSVGTVAGLLIASSVTVAAVAGELTTMGLLVSMSDASNSFQVSCQVGLCVAGLAVLLYAARSAGWLSMQVKPPPPAPKAVTVEGTGDRMILVTPIASGAPSGYGVSSAGVP